MLLVLALAAPQTWTFEKDAADRAPEGFQFTTTASAPAAKWIVRKGDGGQVLAQVEAAAKSRYASAVVAGSSFRDLKLSVRVKTLSGYQRAGVVWRYQDADNYYAAGVNPEEGNVAIFRVVAGKRGKVGQKDVEGLKSGEWATLRVEQRGGSVKLLLGDAVVLEAEDKTFDKAGAVGLWIKDDTVAEFDDLTVEAVE
jgi:hypothetical protein